MNKRDLLERLFKFSVEIIKLASQLPKTPAGYAIASQIIKSGTSIGANCEEAQDSISRKEFLKTINISLKEAKETRYWLRVISASGLLTVAATGDVLKECNEIVAMLTITVKKLKNSL